MSNFDSPQSPDYSPSEGSAGDAQPVDLEEAEPADQEEILPQEEAEPEVLREEAAAPVDLTRAAAPVDVTRAAAPVNLTREQTPLAKRPRHGSDLVNRFMNDEISAAEYAAEWFRERPFNVEPPASDPLPHHNRMAIPSLPPLPPPPPLQQPPPPPLQPPTTATLLSQQHQQPPPSLPLLPLPLSPDHGQSGRREVQLVLARQELEKLENPQLRAELQVPNVYRYPTLPPTHRSQCSSSILLLSQPTSSLPPPIAEAWGERGGQPPHPD